VDFDQMLNYRESEAQPPRLESWSAVLAEALKDGGQRLRRNAVPGIVHSNSRVRMAECEPDAHLPLWWCELDGVRHQMI
jgi:hypothetical protein